MKICVLLFVFTSVLSCAVPAADFDAAVATNQVGLDLYRQLAAKEPGKNFVLSPYSIESALALVYAGADGATRDEMGRVLRFPIENAPLQSAFGDLRTALDQVAEQSRSVATSRRRAGGNIDIIEWHAANRLFGQRGYPFRDSFLALMKNGFAAPFDPLDFKRDAEGARGTINAWVEAQTRSKIHDLIPRGGLTADHRLVLVNALYLKAPWQKPFNKTDTVPRPFHFREGETRDVATMRETTLVGYAAEDGFAAVALDYLGSQLRFLILLPDEGQTVETVATKISAADLTRWARLGEKPGPATADLSLPKFRVEGVTVPLGPALRTLGVKRAFDEPAGSANFDRIAPRKPDDYLALSEVFHQTFIALDEEGTEAAAATAVTMLTLSAIAQPQNPIQVRVDRPFLFAIQHRASGVCLFLGRIADPR